VRTRIALALLLAALVGSATAVRGEARRTDSQPCPAVQDDPAYDYAVNSALAAKQDVWGNELLRSPGGPTYEGVQRHLHPLMLVGPPSGLAHNRLTDSGIYYLAFGRPTDSGGRRSVDLHIADGSQIVSEFVKRARLSIDVGVRPNERFGSCLARLGPARLGGGYLPILQTSYVDADGVAYRQESFATRIPQTHSLVSFVRLTVDPRGSGVSSASVRFTPSVPGLRRVGNQLRRGPDAFMLFAPGGKLHGRALTYTTSGEHARTVYAAWLARPSPTQAFRLGRRSYERARRSVAAYWNRRLAAGSTFLVPDERVLDAERNLLIQNLLHSWRYSLANKYERFSWEMIDVAEVMGEYGFTGLERAIVEKSFHQDAVFPNRADGERMSGTADYYERTGDTRFVRKVTPWLRDALIRFEIELNNSTTGLLDAERYGIDVWTPVYGLHDQALVLQGLRAMAQVWSETGNRFLADKATRVANRLEAGLRAAVTASMRLLPDGSLFAPIALIDGTEQPYDSVTQSQEGSYWNLVMPYALASGLFPPGSPETLGLKRYLANHGSRLLGLVRFRAFTNSGKPGYRSPGVDDVYGTNVVRFLADNDEPDQLVLSLYGKLGADMAPGTFVSGEGSTIGPVQGEYYRSMFRPPNSANNAFFLETLRLMLVHERREGLDLAFATPRSWLEPGRSIVVRRAPTHFGPVSYSLTASAGSVLARVDVPPRLGSATLRLRLRVPAGERIVAATLAGRRSARLDGSETIDLTGLRGRVALVISTSR
jgi:hypothetical protein